MRHFFPRETLVYGETDRDCGVEVTARGWCAGDDGKGDAYGEGPADLEERAKGGDADGRFEVEDEAGDGGNAGKAINMSVYDILL